MRKNMRGMRSAIAGAFLAACAASGAALAIDSAQPLLIDASRSATVDATLGDGAAHFYSFWAKEGDVVTFDVDGDGNIDAWMTVLTPAPTLTVAASVDDSGLPSLDPGSTTSLDPYIENFRIPVTGVYYVAVTAQPNYGVFPYLPVLDGGMVNVSRGNATGTYTLIVSGVSPQEAPPAPAPAPDPVTQLAPTPDPVTPPAPTPDPVTAPTPTPDPVAAPTPDPLPDPVPVALPAGEVQHINIDIKPGRGMIVRLDPKGKHAIPVALLSSREFNALAVDVSSLTFGKTGYEQSLRRCAERGVHVNRDRRPDLVCEFGNDVAQFELGDSEGILRGRTTTGQAFEGRGMLKVIPHKRHHAHAHGKHFDGDKPKAKKVRDDDERKRRPWWRFWR